MTGTLRSLSKLIRDVASAPLGLVIMFAAVYLLLQLIVLPKLGVST